MKAGNIKFIIPGEIKGRNNFPRFHLEVFCKPGKLFDRTVFFFKNFVENQRAKGANSNHNRYKQKLTPSKLVASEWTLSPYYIINICRKLVVQISSLAKFSLSFTKLNASKGRNLLFVLLRVGGLPVRYSNRGQLLLGSRWLRSRPTPGASPSLLNVACIMHGRSGPLLRPGHTESNSSWMENGKVPKNEMFI